MKSIKDELYLPLSEIKKKYADQWVLMVDCKFNGSALQGGRVILTSTDDYEVSDYDDTHLNDGHYTWYTGIGITSGLTW